MDDTDHTDRQSDCNSAIDAGKRLSKQLSRFGVLALSVVGLSAGAYFYWILNQAARNASCRNDVFVLREYLREYASDHGGLLPPISPSSGNLTVDPVGFYPDYLENTCWLQCEWSDARHRGGHGKNDDLGLAGFNDDSFCYLPWAVTNEVEGLAFIEAYKNLNGDARTEDLTVYIDGKQRVLPRIRFSDAVLAKTIDTASPKIPIAVEWPNKFHTDGTVLYANGWIVTMKLGEAFPMTEEFINGLREIASMDKPLSKR